MDKNDKLYVGDGAGYYTNSSGAWVKKPLNGSKWAIDENGNPHTVVNSSSAPYPSTGLAHSELVGGSWTAESVPILDPCPCPGACSPMGASAFDIVVEPNGNPFVVWNTFVEFLGCGTIPQPHAMHSRKVNGVWKTGYSVGKLETSETPYVSATVDGGLLYQAGIVPLGFPFFFQSHPSGSGGGVVGALHQKGTFSGQIALAKPQGQTIFGLFSGLDASAGTGNVPHVVLTESYTTQADYNATLISCPGEKGVHHALNVRPNGDVRLAWVSTSGQVRYATNASGSWKYSDLGPGVSVELVVTSAGQVNVLLENAGDIYRVTPCP